MLLGQCTKVEYEVHSQEFDQHCYNAMNTLATTDVFYIYFPYNVIEKRFRVAHVDFNTFISAIGGSLGLFLGFSLVSALFELYNYLSIVNCKVSV